MSRIIHFFTFLIIRAYSKQVKVNNAKQTVRLYHPKTTGQINYSKNLANPEIDLLLCLGPAGSGKTLLACNEAIHQLATNKISRIVLTRPIVPVEDEQLGFLPGNIQKKMDPWTRPIMDIFAEYYKPSDIAKMLQDNVIEISPLAYMRGRTFKNCFIIADEMQNSTPNQMLMLATRIGENSKMVITGDLNQSDRSKQNGLSDFIEKFEKSKVIPYIAVNKLQCEDIERSRVVKSIIDLYESKEPVGPYYKKIVNDFLDNQKIKDDCALIPLKYNSFEI
jgi:phosphate starvation-inducible PhoH-like protein